MLSTFTNFFLTAFSILLVLLILELLGFFILKKPEKIDLSKILLLILLAVVSLQCFFALWNPVWTNGDEPHYLLVASSLIQDRDLTLKNNYDARDYYPHHGSYIDPHVFVGKDGTHKPFHGILLSFLLVPGYYFLGLEGARFGMQILFILSLVFLYLIQRQLGFSKNISLLSLVIYSLQAPIFVYSSSLYPDLLMGNIVVAGIFLALEATKTKKNYLFVLSGFLMGISVFLHFKILAYIFYAILPILFLSYKNNKFEFYDLSNILAQALVKFSFAKKFFPNIENKNTSNLSQKTNTNPEFDQKKVLKKALYILSPIIFFTFLLCSLGYYWFGYFRPDYMTPFLTSEVYLGYGNPINNTVANLLDYDRGIFWHGPLLIFLIPGLFVWFKKNRTSFICLAIPSFIYLLNAMLFKEWTAGWAPIGRYVMTSLPIISLAFPYLFEEFKNSKVFRLSLLPFLLLNLLFIAIIFAKNYVGYPTGSYNFFFNEIFSFLKIQQLQKVLDINILKGGNFALSKAYLILISLIAFSYFLVNKKFSSKKV